MAPSSARNDAPVTSSARRPFGQARRYSKNPAPAPFCLPPVHRAPRPHAPRRGAAGRGARPQHAQPPPVGDQGLVAGRGALPHHEGGEVALQHAARRVLEAGAQHRDGAPGGHGDRDRLERPRRPRREGHLPLPRPPLAEAAEVVVADELELQRELGAGRGVGEERGPQRHRHRLARLRRRRRVRAHRHVEGRVPVAQRHPRHELAEARLLLRAVGADVAVPLVDHVVVLRVEPARHLRVAAQLVHHGVVVEAPVHVARRALVAPDVAALAVEHGLLALLAAAHEVPGRAGEGLRLGLVERRLPLPPGQVHVPGVEVRLHVPPAAAGGVVLDEARRVELLGEVEALPDPLLRLGEPGGLAVRALRLQAPLLVEQHPREDRRVVEVAAHHAAQSRLPLLPHGLVGLAPAVRHVGHDQDAQPVGPVELARDLDLDVGADRVEPQPPRDQDLLAHRLVGRPGPEAVGVPGLVEGHLEVDRLAVQRHVRVAEPGRPLDTELPEAEVRLHAVLGPARRERQGRVVQEGVLERPQARSFPEGQGQAGLAAPDGHERLRFARRRGPPGRRSRPSAPRSPPGARGRRASRAPPPASGPGPGGTRAPPRRRPGGPRGRRSATARAPCRSPACPRA